jgi:CHAT domain-containing protein
VSLWNVNDRVTVELMRHFYRGILVEGLSPAAALRAAQNAIRRQANWQAPYYWAGFTLQGEWR